MSRRADSLQLMRIAPLKRRPDFSWKFASVRRRPIWSLGRTFRSPPRGSRSAKIYSRSYLLTRTPLRPSSLGDCGRHYALHTRPLLVRATSSCHRGVTCFCVFPRPQLKPSYPLNGPFETRSLVHALVFTSVQLRWTPEYGHRGFPFQKTKVLRMPLVEPLLRDPRTCDPGRNTRAGATYTSTYRCARVISVIHGFYLIQRARSRPSSGVSHVYARV